MRRPLGGSHLRNSEVMSMANRYLVLGLLGLLGFGLGINANLSFGQDAKHLQDCKKRLIEWRNEEDLGIRMFYSPALGEAFHFPIVFLPMSPLDQRLGSLDREVIGVTPSEMRALLSKLADSNLDWRAYNDTISLFPGAK